MRVTVPGVPVAAREEGGRGKVATRPFSWHRPPVTARHNEMRTELTILFAELYRRRMVASPALDIAIVNEVGGQEPVEYLNDLDEHEMECALENLRAHYLGK